MHRGYGDRESPRPIHECANCQMRHGRSHRLRVNGPTVVVVRSRRFHMAAFVLGRFHDSGGEEVTMTRVRRLPVPALAVLLASITMVAFAALPAARPPLSPAARGESVPLGPA